MTGFFSILPVRWQQEQSSSESGTFHNAYQLASVDGQIIILYNLMTTCLWNKYGRIEADFEIRGSVKQSKRWTQITKVLLLG